MTVKDLLNWLQDKPLDSELVKSTDIESWEFTEIGLVHRDKIRRDHLQGDLFNE